MNELKDYLPAIFAAIGTAAGWLVAELRAFLKERAARRLTDAGSRKLDLESLLVKVEQKWKESDAKVEALERHVDSIQEELGETRTDFHVAVVWIRNLEDKLTEKQIPFRLWDEFFKSRRPNREATPSEGERTK